VLSSNDPGKRRKPTPEERVAGGIAILVLLLFGVFSAVLVYFSRLHAGAG
jgi:hypothetical protein